MRIPYNFLMGPLRSLEPERTKTGMRWKRTTYEAEKGKAKKLMSAKVINAPPTKWRPHHSIEEKMQNRNKSSHEI